MVSEGARRRAGWTILAVALLALMAGRVQEAGARAMVKAPNFTGEIDVDRPPPEVTRALRAEVGPPRAILEAWILDPPGPARGTALLLHGTGGDKRSMLSLGRALSQRGMRAVLVDLRGHGGSSGRWLTYGVVESRDLSQLIDQLDALRILEGPLGVYGVSYGGAVALQLAAIDPRVQAVVGNSTLPSFREAVPRYAERQLPGLGAILPSILLDSVAESAGELGGFSPDAADARAAIASSRARILLIHGENDRVVHYSQAESLFSACGPDRCTLLPLAGVGHREALGSAVAERAAALFLESHATTWPSSGGAHPAD